jgi:hypothetical protein
MTSGNSGRNQPTGLLRGRRYKAAKVFFCTALAMLAMTSCRRESPVAKNTAHQQASAAKAEPLHVQSKEEQSCQEFVQKFYDWRVSLLVDGLFCRDTLKGTNASQEAIKENEEECKVASAYRNAEKLNLQKELSPKLLHYLKMEEDVQKKEEDPGLDFDPYLNTQDPSPKFLVNSVYVSGNRCDALVHGYDRGQQHEEIMPELSRTNGGWVIENFHYRFDMHDGKPPQDDNLIHMLREYLGKEKYPAE